jgi:WhiB family redox-sensing transcriptional regulator
VSASAGVPQASHRPVRSVTDTKWMADAACVGLPADVLFPEHGAWVTSGARRVCGGCPVRVECLEYALCHGEWHGTWGGLSVDERRELARKRRQVKV